MRLGVSLEAADVLRDLVEGALAVVAEGRVAEVVGEAGRVHDVRVAPEGLAELAPDLRDLERVREARADEVPCPGDEHLRLGAEPAKRAAVDDPRAVPLERRAPLALGGLLDPALDVGVGVAGRGVVTRRCCGAGRRPALAVGT